MKLFPQSIFRHPPPRTHTAAALCAATPNDHQPRQSQQERFEKRIALLRETFDLLEIDVIRQIGEVMQAGDAAHQDISRLATSTREISAGSAELAASAENAAQYVRELAAASTELKASGEEINRRLREVTSLALEGKQATRDAHVSADGLKTSSGEIGSITGLISSIARKIDLVALNSMIEAARAGGAGRAFGIVAGEVKSLASATQKATEDIARRVEKLQQDSNRLIACVESIGSLIESLSPVIFAIAAEVETQTRMTAGLSRSTGEAAAFAHGVDTSAKATAAVCTTTAATAVSAGESIERLLHAAENLRSRFVVFLRETEMGNRRQHDRLPCDLNVTFTSGFKRLLARAVDISDGGMLARLETESELPTGTQLETTVENLGTCATMVVGRSAIGLHLKWIDLSPAFREALRFLLEHIRADHADLIATVTENAQAIGKAMEAAVDSGRTTMEALFDADYELIDGTAPPQYRTRALPVLEEILAPIQNHAVNSNPKVVFCVALDRNAWLPVHNPEWSQPQRPGEYEWNYAHARNRRIFDDRAGLAAARNIRPSLIQIYNRDLGGGNFALMKEVNAPIRVFGRHWGGLRIAYKRESQP